MKTLYLYALALMATFAAPALADSSATTLGGCALTDKGGYSVKADPTCEYRWANDNGEDRQFVDADNDPTTPDVRDPLGN